VPCSIRGSDEYFTVTAPNPAVARPSISASRAAGRPGGDDRHSSRWLNWVGLLGRTSTTMPTDLRWVLRARLPSESRVLGAGGLADAVHDRLLKSTFMNVLS
jgi:hypothetical protein